MYFYDIGLASYLLNIQNETQIARDPLYGHLFENMVVAEALKYRFNHGRHSNLYFYRDSKGNEVDLLLVNGPDIFPGVHYQGMNAMANIQILHKKLIVQLYYLK